MFVVHAREIPCSRKQHVYWCHRGVGSYNKELIYSLMRFEKFTVSTKYTCTKSPGMSFIHGLLPRWWVSSRSFIISSNFAGSVLHLATSLSLTVATLDTSVSSREPGDASWEARSEYIEDARPEPYENNTILAPASCCAL